MNNENKLLQNILAKNFSEFKTNTAIESGNKFVTYEILEKHSNYIANWIVSKGFKKEGFIGILMNDRIEFITVMIGILKAACVFIPLESEYSKKRMVSVIESTNIELIICDKLNYHEFEFDNTSNKKRTEFAILDDLYLYKVETMFLQEPKVNYTPEDRIYIYFTSGTTGKPKAIVGKNKSLVHFINWEITEFCNNKAGLRVSQFINPGFDAILRDVFVPLCSGGVICIPESRDIMLNAAKLIDWIENSKLNLIHCVPSLFRFLNSGNLTGDHFKSLQFIFLSGEKIYPADLEKWYQIFGDRIHLVNFYGPTETTMIKTFYRIQSVDVNKGFIPIGKPMKGARVIILDADMKACDELVPGELYIRTPYRTFGYYNEPELNKQCFIPNPFNNDPDDLIYKTGDLARVLPDKNIELLGRIDRQVKIRGIRVELEGIESALRQHSAVNEAVIINKEMLNSNTILIAFITRNENFPDTVESLTTSLMEYLNDNLPNYLVPVYIIEIKKIPRKANLKVDFEALHRIFENERTGYISPRDDIEEKLVALWTEILGKQKIGIHDNFFQLGGNSLNIMPLVSKIHKLFHVNISLKEVFNNPDIEKQADIIRKVKKQAIRRKSEIRYISIQPVEKKQYYTLSSPQKRLFVLQQMALNNIGYNMTEVIVLEGELDRQRLVSAFQGLLLRHEILRTSFPLIVGEPIQKIHEPGELEFKIEYFETPGDREIEIIIKKFVRPFCLSNAPLLRVGLLRMTQEKNLLIVDMHHIVSDGISMVLLRRDFAALYAREELPPLKLTYKDFSEWQRNPDRQEMCKSQETFWLSEFAGEIPLINLPTDFPRPNVKQFEGNGLTFEIQKEKLVGLQSMAAAEGATLFMVLIALFNILLSKVSAQECIVVGIPSAGRSHSDLENIIGMMVNTLALRNFPAGHKTFRQFLAEVKESALQAFDNQDFPFEDLVKRLGLDKDTSRNPLFDVMFVLQNMNIDNIQLPKLKLLPFNNKLGAAKFDLTLKCYENGERLYCTLEYCTKLFKQEKIERFVGYFKDIVDVILKKKDIMLKDITISHGLSALNVKANELQMDFAF